MTERELLSCQAEAIGRALLRAAESGFAVCIEPHAELGFVARARHASGKRAPLSVARPEARDALAQVLTTLALEAGW